MDIDKYKILKIQIPNELYAKIQEFMNENYLINISEAVRYLINKSIIAEKHIKLLHDNQED